MNNADAQKLSSQSSPNSSSATDFFGLMDRLLRDRESFFDEIFSQQNLKSRLRWFLVSILLLGAFYGSTMGLMGIKNSWTTGLMQMLVSSVKVPVLFLLSLAVCFPVLYIVLVLMGAKLKFSQTLALILMAMSLNAVLLASCAPIIIFFIVTGSDYHFIKLLHVCIFTFSGGWAMMSLWQGLYSMCEKANLYPRQAVQILKIWILVFGFVGTQMAWSLRPFVGSPSMEFQIIRQQTDGNFYSAVWHAVLSLGKEAQDQLKQNN